MRTIAHYTGTSGLYVRVQPLHGMKPFFNSVRDALEQEGIELCNPLDLHCTLMYSPDHSPHTVDVCNVLNRPPFEYTAWSINLDFWEGHDNKGYLVLKLLCPDLVDRHGEYRAIGARPTFDDYTPHITIADGLGMPQCLPELQKMLTHVKFNIKLGSEHAEDIKR